MRNNASEGGWLLSCRRIPQFSDEAALILALVRTVSRMSSLTICLESRLTENQHQLPIEGYESPTPAPNMADNPSSASTSNQDSAVSATGDNSRSQRGDRDQGGRGRGRGRGRQDRGRGKGFGSKDSGERHKKRDMGRGEYLYVIWKPFLLRN